MNSNDLSAYNEIFLKSSGKHIGEILAILSSLKSTSLTPEIIDNLYLHLHSLKGECNVMGLNHIASLCEQALTILKEEKLSMTNSLNLLNSIGGTTNIIQLEITKLSQTQETKTQTS